MKFDLPNVSKCDVLDQESPTYDQTSPTLNAYLRNIREISNKIDLLSDEENKNILKSTPLSDKGSVGAANEFFEMNLGSSYQKTSLLSSLENQTQETLELLKQEAADNLALHIALEDHLMEQMENTQNKLKQNISVYLDVIGKLNDLQEADLETEGLLQ